MSDIQNEKFDSLLNKFKSLIANDPSPKDVERKLVELKDEAKASDINFRQQEAILARCDNYIKGEYGHTKTDKQMGLK